MRASVASGRTDARGALCGKAVGAAAGAGVEARRPVETATVLLTGATCTVSDDDLAVPADYLTATGLTTPAERAASSHLVALPPGRLPHLLNAAMPADPEALWRSGPDVARLAAAWDGPRGGLGRAVAVRVPTLVGLAAQDASSCSRRAVASSSTVSVPFSETAVRV